MTIRDLIEAASSRLTDAGIEAPRQDAWLLLCHATGRDRAHLIAHAGDALPPSEAMRFLEMVERRRSREPAAQILGIKEFWSLPLAVNVDVLCPRPESETLVEAALALASERTAPLSTGIRILDLGTGSGCLLLALLHELPAASGIGVDHSHRALAVAMANGRRLRLEHRVDWVQSDWGTALGGVFDLIVSNPPYVRSADLAALAPEIRLFEPHGALLAGEDGLAAYRRLAFDLERLLASGGAAAIELGHGQAGAVSALMTEAGLAPVARHRDLAGIERCLTLRRCR